MSIDKYTRLSSPEEMMEHAKKEEARLSPEAKVTMVMAASMSAAMRQMQIPIENQQEVAVYATAYWALHKAGVMFEEIDHVALYEYAKQLRVQIDRDAPMLCKRIEEGTTPVA